MAQVKTGELDQTSIPDAVAEPLMYRLMELDALVKCADHVGSVKEDIRAHLSAAAFLLASAWIPEPSKLVGELGQHSLETSTDKMTRQ